VADNIAFSSRLCGFEPFWDDTGEMAVCRRIVEGEFSFPSPWWDDISDSAKNLITQVSYTVNIIEFIFHNHASY
jgi:hypothetical protein